MPMPCQVAALADISEERLSVHSTDDNADKGAQASERARVFKPLPPPAKDSRALFSRDLEAVVDLLGGDATAQPGIPGWRSRARAVIRAGLKGRETLPGPFFDALIAAGVHDPDPSLNAEFIKPATAAFGCLRVREALLGYLRDGTNAERAGAARASYWASAAWRWRRAGAVLPGHLHRRAGREGPRRVGGAEQGGEHRGRH